MKTPTACAELQAALQRAVQTTHLSDDDYVTITHPFHPKAGKEYTLVGLSKSGGKEKLLCKDADGEEFFVDIGLTSMGQKVDWDDQAKATCDFRYEDLVALSDAMGEISVK